VGLAPEIQSKEIVVTEDYMYPIQSDRDYRIIRRGSAFILTWRDEFISESQNMNFLTIEAVRSKSERDSRMHITEHNKNQFKNGT
jgi:hypothetical protein